MEGTIRTLERHVLDEIKEKVRGICERSAKVHECEAIVELEEKYPPVINHSEQANYVKQLAIDNFGPQNVSDEGLPVPGGEDFAFYLEKIPGCYFILVTYDEKYPDRVLH